MSTKYSLHLRSTANGTGASSPWNEASPSAYVIGDTYPITRNGLTFGYTNGANPFKTDSGTANDARLSGRHNLTVADKLRIDLPDGAGNYKVWLALGALNAANATSYTMFDSDGTTVLTQQTPQSPASGSVMDASGNILTFANWLTAGGTEVNVTISGDHFYIGRNGTNGMYLNTVEFQLQPIALTSAAFTNDLGAALTTIYANQPQGQKIAKITAAGAQSFTLAGTLAGNFTIALQSDGHYWIVAGNSRLADAATGTLQVVQTDANGSNSPFSTDVLGGTSAVTITSSQGRPTDGSILGLISTQTYLKRKAIKDVTDLAWAGWTNQTFATDTLATSTADLITKIGAAITAKTGSSWHRIRCGTGGDWTAAGTLPAGDFGTGGLLITKDAASDPVIDGIFSNFNHLMVGWHFYDLTLGMGTVVSTNRQFQIEAPTSGTTFHKLKFSNCRIGRFYSSGYSLSGFAGWGQFLLADGCEDLILENNTVRGIEHLLAYGNVKRLVVKNNDSGLVYGDTLDVSQIFRPGAPVVGTDIYIAKSGNIRRDQPDVFTTLNDGSALHADDIQLNVPLDQWASGASVTLGTVRVNLTVSKVYTCSQAGTTGATAPTGTGTAIVDGTAKWDYLKDYIPPKLHILVENELIVAGGTTSYVNSGGSLSMPGGSGIQDNLTNLASSATVEVVYINNMGASPDLRGVQLTNGTVYAEFNTFVGPFEIPAYDASHSLNVIEKGLQITTSGTLRAKGNIVGISSGAAFVSAPTVASQDNIGVGFVGSTAAGQTPSDLLVGTFTQRAGDSRWVYTADDTIATDGVALQSVLSKMMRPKTGRIGARLKELHTLTITDAATGSSTVTLEIDP